MFACRQLTNRRCASLCTATNKKMAFCLFWTATKTNQNAWIFQKNWLLPSPPAISFFNLKKLTWLHKFFRLFFIPADSCAKAANSWFQLCCHSTSYIKISLPWKSSNCCIRTISRNLPLGVILILSYIFHAAAKEGTIKLPALISH